MPEYYRQFGEAAGAAMAHNARMAADLAAARAAREALAAPERPVCACHERGQDRDGWVRYQGRDGEFVELRCCNHQEG